MDGSDGIELLLDAGLNRRVASSAEVEISTGDGHWSRHQVLLLRHSPSPQEINRGIESLRRHVNGLLFVVPHAGRALNRAAEKDHRIAYAAVDDAVVSFQGVLHHGGKDRSDTLMQAGRVSWTWLGMLRLFALTPIGPLTQSEIARRLGVSHVAVGKQLPLPEDLIEPTSAGWQAVDRAACWDRFMTDYPGPRGLATYWAAITDISDQLERIERIAREHGAPAPAVSGDFAADMYAPWRRPGHIIAYVAEQPPLEEHGFASVRSADSTVELRTPQDPTVLLMSRQWPSASHIPARRYTDPLITAWDLRRSPGGDVDSALDQLQTRARRTPLWT